MEENLNDLPKDISKNLNDLPKDVLTLLAIEMNLPDILSLCKTNKRTNDLVCNNETFWMNKYNKDFAGFIDFYNEENIKKYTYRELYEATYIYKKYASCSGLLKESLKSGNMALAEYLSKIPKCQGIRISLFDISDIKIDSKKKLKVFNMLLTKDIIDLKASTTAMFENPFIYAISMNDIKTVKTMLEKSDRKSLTTYFGPKSLSVLYNSPEVMDYFIDNNFLTLDLLLKESLEFGFPQFLDYYMNKLCILHDCTEEFWKNKLVEMYGQKSLEYKDTNKTWGEYFYSIFYGDDNKKDADKEWGEYFYSILYYSTRYTDERAIIEASKNGRLDLVKFFISRVGKFKNKYKSCEEAMRNKHYDIVKYFLQNYKFKFNSTGYGWALLQKNNEMMEYFENRGVENWDYVLFFACMRGDPDVINSIIDEHNLKEEDYLVFGLSGASEGGHLDLVKLFLKKGAAGFEKEVLEGSVYKGFISGNNDVINFYKEKYEREPWFYKSAIRGASYSGNIELLDRVIKWSQDRMSETRRIELLKKGAKEAAEEGNFDTLKYLTGHGVKSIDFSIELFKEGYESLNTYFVYIIYFFIKK